jgi:hypothetical protein
MFKSMKEIVDSVADGITRDELYEKVEAICNKYVDLVREDILDFNKALGKKQRDDVMKAADALHYFNIIMAKKVAEVEQGTDL